MIGAFFQFIFSYLLANNRLFLQWKVLFLSQASLIHGTPGCTINPLISQLSPIVPTLNVSNYRTIYFLKEIVLLNQSFETVISICILLIQFLQKLKSKFYRFGWMIEFFLCFNVPKGKGNIDAFRFLTLNCAVCFLFLLKLRWLKTEVSAIS